MTHTPLTRCARACLVTGLLGMLIAKGEPVIPARQEALAGAEESGQKVVEAAQPQPDAKQLIQDWVMARNKDFKAHLTPVSFNNASTAQDGRAGFVTHGDGGTRLPDRPTRQVSAGIATGD